MKSVKYIGMDVHQATTVVAVQDGEGKLVLETVIATEAAAMLRFVEGLSGELHVAFVEAAVLRRRTKQPHSPDAGPPGKKGYGSSYLCVDRGRSNSRIHESDCSPRSGNSFPIPPGKLGKHGRDCPIQRVRHQDLPRSQVPYLKGYGAQGGPRKIAAHWMQEGDREYD